MADWEELLKLLRSDKVTHRKKGRTECDSRLFRDRLAVAMNPSLTMAFLHGAVECEITEINLSQNKEKPVDVDISTFFRNMVKYCCTHGQLKSHKTGFLFEHILDILCNEDLPAVFRSNHKNALTYLLVPSALHSMPFSQSLKNVIIYIKDIMVDTVTLKDPLNHKLLKATCMCMFADDSCQAAFVANVLVWFVRLLHQSSEDTHVHALVTATVCECCASFLKYQGVSLYSTVSRELEVIFQAAVKYLCAYQFRETHKDAYFSFIDVYLQTYTSYREAACLSMDASSSVSGILAQLCEYLLSEVHIRSLVTGMRTHPAHTSSTKDGNFVSAQEILSEENSKWMTVYTIMARLVRSCNLGSAHYLAENALAAGPGDAAIGHNKTSRADAQLSSSQHLSKRMRAPDSRAVATPGVSNSSSSTINGSNLLSTEQYALATRISDLQLDPAVSAVKTTSYPSTPAARTSHNGTSGSTHSAHANGRGLSAHSAPSSSVGRQYPSQMLEGYLVLLLVSLRTHPTGTILRGDAYKSSIIGGVVGECDISATREWVLLIKRKLEDALQFACEPQLVGVALLCLVDLCKLSKRLLLGTSERSMNFAASGGALRVAWAEVLVVLTSHPKLVAFCPPNASVRKDTVFAHLLQLLRHVVALVDPGVLAGVQGALWRFSPVQNPTLVDTPVCFTYLASLVCSGGHEVPTPVTAAVAAVLQQLDRQDLLDILSSERTDAGAEAGPPSTTSGGLPRFDSPSFPGIGANLLQKHLSNQLPMVCLLTWLYAQLSPVANNPSIGSASVVEAAKTSSIQFAASASSHTRFPVSQLHGYVSAVRALVLAVVTGSEARALVPRTTPSRDAVSVRSNVRHWVESPPVEAPAGLLDTGALQGGAIQHGSALPVGADVVDQLTLAAQLLSPLMQQLLAIVTSSGLKNEASEQFNAWQTVSLLALAACASLLNTAHHAVLAVAAQVPAAPVLSDALSELRSTLQTSFLLLAKAVLVYTEKKIVALKLVQVSEYFDALADVLVLAQPALAVIPAVEAQLQRLRTLCISSLVKAARVIHSVVLNKGNKATTKDHFEETGGAGAAMAVDDDEFMEHGIQKSTTNRANLEDSGAEDGADGEGPVGRGSKNTLLFSKEQLQAFVAVCKCAVALQEGCGPSTGNGQDVAGAVSAAVPVPQPSYCDADAINKLVESLFSTDSFGQVVKLQVDAESKLILAQAVTTCSPSGTASIAILNRCPWHLEWGSLGYCKVLQIMHELLLQHAFWATADPVLDFSTESVLGQMVDFVLPQDNEILENYLLAQWRCRYEQLLCIGQLMRHADVNAVKGAISPTFLSAFADANSSVRFCAAGLVPLLLPLFKKTQTVYASLLKGTGIPLVSPHGGTPSATQNTNLTRSESSGAERPLDVVALAVGIARMGGTVATAGATGATEISASTMHPLARQALLDLMKLACSRKGAGAQVVGKIDDVNYSALLHLSVSQLAQQLGYERVDLMLREYLRWLVHEWLLLGMSEKDREGSSASQSGGLSQSKSSAQRLMTLADFPFALLSATHAGTQLATDHGTKVQEFLRAQSSTIVPVICQLEHTRYRWSCILQYATAAGYGSTDRDVAVIVKRNVCPLKALELTLQCAGNLRSSSGQDYELMTVDLTSPFTTCAQKSQFQAQSVQEFVTRSSSAAELSVYLTSKVTDTVSEIFLLQTAEALDDVESSGDTTMAGVAALLSATLKQMGSIVGSTTLSELFDRCNLLDLLSAMHVRLLESRKESVNTAVLAMLQMLVRHHPAVLAKSFLSGVLHVLHSALSLFPQNFAAVVQVMEDMVTHVIEKLIKPSDDAKKIDPSPSKRPEQAVHTAEEIARFAPELLSECLLMLKFAALQLGRNSDPSASTALKALVNSGKLDRHAAVDDGFTLAYFSRSACLVAENHLPSTGSAIPVTQNSVAALNLLVQRVLLHCSNTFKISLFAAVLPLPTLLHSECFQQGTRDYAEPVAHLTIQDRIRSIMSIVQNKISGELVPLSFIWLQVQIICDALLPVLDHSANVGGTTRSEGSVVARNAAPVSCSWNGDVDLLSTFLSTLVGLCKHSEQQTLFHLSHSSPSTPAVTTTGAAPGSGVSLESTVPTPVQQSLRQAALRLLGHFGAPDLLSLNQTKFPLQTGHLTKESNFDVECMKQRLLLRAFALLWSAPSVAKVAAACLRDLTCVGYFANQQNKFDSTSALETQLLELTTAYTHSVIGREKKAGASAAGTRIETEEADLWSAPLWSTCNKASYNAWICPLCYRLIDECYAELQTAAGAALSNKYPITKTADAFVVAMKSLVLVRSDFAEGLMPLVIQGILKSNGVNSFAHSELSSLIATHLLAPQCCYTQATQLGCNMLTFLMRQDVTDFLAQRVAASPRGSAQRIEPSKSQLSEWSLPFSYVLTIDLKFAAQAATRCQLTCTALLFAELSDEDDRSAAENERGVAASTLQQTFGGTNKVSRVASADSGLHDLLLPIYEKIHDPDAIYGIDLCSSLELQALMYTRRGRWMEALSTYEGIIQSRSAGPSIHAAETGIAKSLRALGAQHTLQGFSSHFLQGVGRAGHSGMSHQPLSAWHPAVSSFENGASSGVTTTSGTSAAGNFFTDISQASTSATHAVPVVDDSAHISSLLADITKPDSTAVSVRVQKSSSVLFSHILRRMCDETAANVLPYLAQAQHLTEINEASVELAADVHQRNHVQRTSLGADGKSSPTVQLLHRWRARQAQSSNASQSESQFALRSTLLRKLLNAGHITALDAIECLHQGDGIAKTVNAAHAVTPQIYKFWNEISAQVKHRSQASLSDHSAVSFADTLISASLAYCECRLLWAKGLKEASIASINTKVIHKLKLMLQDMAEVNSNGVAQAANIAQKGKTSRAVVASASAKYTAAAAYFQDVETQTRGRNLLSAALCTGGEWISTKRAATGTEILDDYLDPAVQYATGTAELIRAYTTLADFHARLYQNLKAKVHSAEWQQGARVLADRKKEYDECRVLQDKLRRESNGSGVSGDAIDAKTLYRHVATLKKEIELDSKERESVEQSVNRYLVAAVSDFAKVLELSKEADVDCVFRLVQLWLSNCENAQINALMDDVITSIPSYKFAPLSYQILSRLGGPDDALSPMGSSQTPLRLSEKLRESPRPGFNRTTTACSTFSVDANEDAESGFQLALCRMVLKLCTEHPHHILPQLFALAHEREFSDDGAAHVKKNLSVSRLETANMLVTQLQTNAAVRELVVATRSMLLAYIDLASASTLALQKVGRTKGIKFKEVQPRGKRFNEVMESLTVAPAVITLSFPLSPVNDYSNVVRIDGFQQTFSITDNGISRPKIVTCMGSDGRSYVQLVKGGDDMRQDAVMQQVFANVNFTLSRDEETQKRNLGIRTYKIIPTTPQTGILEWVQNTAAFGSLLCDRDSGAHGRYYPNDWTHSQCREHLKDAADNADKLRRYQEVCARFHPAFRFFFLEKFADPVTWVASRLAYSRSVAANSIIGYILGIGDRHAHNILMDTVTAEVVHIDFGIVFEQGKGLGTPETVPFRLTRDVVDGMGVTACEGTFRRSCEEVLRVLRDNSLQIMTILEVVIHDPLYKWSLSPLQARMKQNTVPDYQNELLATKEGSRKGQLYPAQQTAVMATVGTKGGSFGKDAAERTLLRVLHKLQGQEDPSSGEALSVEGQVDLLINEARSAANLSKLFPGWAPWL